MGNVRRVFGHGSRWAIVKADPGRWLVYQPYKFDPVAEFPTGAEAFAAFSGGR